MLPGAGLLVLASGLFAFIFSALGTRWLSRHPRAAGRLDYPNDRSLHDVPTPRSGGLAIAAALVLSCGLVMLVPAGRPDHFGYIAVGALLIVAVSLLDDWFGVHPVLRLSVHAASAWVTTAGGLVVLSLSLPGTDWAVPIAVATLFSCVYIVWMTNLYNFMDGMDGFAAGMAVVGFGSFGLLAYGNEDAFLFSVSSFVIAGAGAGFLLYNFPPARIFMGDVGSSLLGFLAAVFSIWADVGGIFPLWVAILIFSPFIADATLTLAMRLVRRERVWQAHRTHHYQRLVRLGWGHRKTVVRAYSLMLACALSAVVAGHWETWGQWAILSLWVGVYAAIAVWVKRWECRRCVE